MGRNGRRAHQKGKLNQSETIIQWNSIQGEQKRPSEERKNNPLSSAISRGPWWDMYLVKEAIIDRCFPRFPPLKSHPSRRLRKAKKGLFYPQNHGKTLVSHRQRSKPLSIRNQTTIYQLTCEPWGILWFLKWFLNSTNQFVRLSKYSNFGWIIYQWLSTENSSISLPMEISQIRSDQSLIKFQSSALLIFHGIDVIPK